MASESSTRATCGAFSGFAPVTLNGSGDDTTVTDNTCYTYQLVVTDNVGNTYTAASASVAQIPDISPPTFVTAAATAASGVSAALSSRPRTKSESAIAPTVVRARGARRTTATRITSSQRPGNAIPPTDARHPL